MILLTSFFMYILTFKCSLFQMHYPSGEKNQELLKYHSLFYYFIRWLLSLIVDIISFFIYYYLFYE